MHRMNSSKFGLDSNDEIQLVECSGICNIPSWLIHTQMELNGKRVFVRRIEIVQRDSETDTWLVGLVVSPVY